MRYVRFIVVVFAVFAIGSLGFSAQPFAADDDPVTVVGILTAAGCPLTEEQAKILNDFQPEEGQRGAIRELYELFSDAQMTALKEKLGTSPARGERPERVRSLFQVIILEKEGCPLTEKQVADLKDIPMERGSFQRMGEVYTEEQREAMAKYRGRGRRGGGGGGNR